MKHFTLDEARETLELVRPLVERMVAAQRELARCRGELASVRTAVAGNGGSMDRGAVSSLEASAQAASDRLASCLAGIHDLGVQVKDVDRGLVDFPALHPCSGDTVLLCWHAGEPDIAYWHGLEEGFAGRKPLPF